MEKKGNRNPLSSCRASAGTDLKKNTDAASSKQGARAAPRRREPPGGFSKLNETNRKPQSQRNGKASDKRPKPRGYYYTGAVSRNEEACLVDFLEPELGSVFSPGSKKQSLNHLLNFSFAPRENSSGFPHDHSFDKQNGKGLGTKKHRYNKNHYLQANCQFIVNENGDYRQYMKNPDVLVDWDFIEQVNVQVSEEPFCPICLERPIAAKMTKCGHVYCWSCILHYLGISEKDFCKCPICSDDVLKNDLKSVQVIAHKTYKLNDFIGFKLMKRPRGCLTAYPVDAVIQPDTSILNISQKNEDNTCSKLFLANKGNILEILDREKDELDCLLALDEGGSEKCFIEEAQHLLEARRLGVLNSAEAHTNEVTNYQDDASCSEFNEASESDFYYFYQAEDAQHIYLHGLNAAMIKHTHGSLKCGPKHLKGRILEKEGGCMTEDIRQKYRYLKHLPVTCQVEFAEICLNEPDVNADTLELYKKQIDYRKKKRQKRLKDEKRRERKIDAEENRKMGIYVSPDLQLENLDHFPDVYTANEMLESRQRTTSDSTFFGHLDVDTTSGQDSPTSNTSLDNAYCGPSFATMLATEKKTSPNQRASAKPITYYSPSSEDFEQKTDYSLTIGDAVAKALENLQEGGASGSGKKKKKKHKLVYSTLMTLPN
ncbi:RING finger protein 10 [Dendroctonus ponderosae]|nr:RING finger protein 10 [Dendroctonus ponderosae]